ncbi:MAG: SUMF1/EgtB/PvdO family nonheme iron enzyme [Ruminococcus sp.]
MYASVRDNGGFYAGRIEAGKENGTVVVKQGVEVFNHVTWSKNGEMNEEIAVEGTEDNPDGAIELARNFDTLNDYTSVTSTLMYGVQWDVVMQWIDPAYKEGSYLAGNVYEWTMESFDTDSRINRGGNYYSTGTVYPASSRNANIPSMTHDNFGFRIALYLDN